jgi:hypothetical protein
VAAIEPSAYRGRYREFKVYDDTRRPPEWTALVGPTQCAVFLKDVKTANPLALDGAEVEHIRDCTFFLFDRLDEACGFCETQVQRYPRMCCDVFDADGKAKPPMMVVMHPSAAAKDELSPSSVKWRKNVAIASLVGSAGLFAADWRSEFELTWPSILAVNLFLLGLRFLYWNTVSGERRRTQARRVAEHLRRERGQAPQTPTSNAEKRMANFTR